MTRANQWLLFGGTLSVGAGFVAGMMFSRRGATPCAADRYPAYGNIYYVGDDTYLDGAAIEFLTARADYTTADEEWTVFHFHARLLYIKKLHDGAVFPGQRGPAYLRRRPITERGQARYEEMTSAMLGDLGGFGTLKSHRWPSWEALKDGRQPSIRTDKAATRQEKP
ncbi:MAG: hypothetical protein JNL82_17535 [Myxococcales bacterium]|nr:hypothetical protein [Myxococcales bacterium]